MKKVIVLVFFTFILVTSIFSQSVTVLEHSNSFEDITEQFQKRAKDISLEFNYFSSGFESTYFPVLNEENKRIVGEDKFAILWLGSEILDLNFLFLCNMETNEAIVFDYRKEYLEGHIECSMLDISMHLIYHIANVYNDPKWYQQPETF